LLADLDGMPILQHVLRAVGTAAPDVTVVVLGEQAARIESAIAWTNEYRVVNESPELGLSGSLKIGLGAIRALDPAESLRAILIVLGDQPRVRPSTIATLLAVDTDQPIVAPRYADGGLNPVLVRRAAWPLVSGASGDRGLGPILAASPALVHEIAIPGDNPDVDTAADLARLATPAEE
jgi:molybdenum cofactor cytidylyltransferase